MRAFSALFSAANSCCYFLWWWWRRKSFFDMLDRFKPSSVGQISVGLDQLKLRNVGNRSITGDLLIYWLLLVGVISRQTYNKSQFSLSLSLHSSRSFFFIYWNDWFLFTKSNRQESSTDSSGANILMRVCVHREKFGERSECWDWSMNCCLGVMSAHASGHQWWAPVKFHKHAFPHGTPCSLLPAWKEYHGSLASRSFL